MKVVIISRSMIEHEIKDWTEHNSLYPSGIRPYSDIGLIIPYSDMCNGFDIDHRYFSMSIIQ